MEKEKSLFKSSQRVRKLFIDTTSTVDLDQCTISKEKDKRVKNIQSGIPRTQFQ